jgi:signal transduction histidine kinase
MAKNDDTEQPAKSVANGTPASGVRTANAAVLIVDPTHSVGSEAKEILQKAGFQSITVAADTKAALSEIASTPPSIVLSIPGDANANGLALIAGLKDGGDQYSGPILFCTDAPDHAAHRELLSYAGTDFVSLPLDPVELIARVQSHARLQTKLDRRTKRLDSALALLKETEKRLTGELDSVRTENRDRIDYFAETHHELRTPLNAICGMSDAMRQESFGPMPDGKYKEYASNIFEAGQHLLSIIDARLDLTRIEVGAEPLEIEDVSVNSVIEETTEMLGQLAVDANINLEIDIEPDLPIIETDKRKLRQVLVNLVSNAIKYTPENGRVMMSAKRAEKDGVLVLVVSDTGIGMTAENLHEVMKPYKRGAHDQKGTGLGLPIARKLIELLGGKIDLRSAPGRGTSVRIELPTSIPGQSPPKDAVG